MHHPEIGVNWFSHEGFALTQITARDLLFDCCQIFPLVLGLDAQVIQLLLQLFDEVGVLDVDMFWLLLEDWRWAFLQESRVG